MKKKSVTQLRHEFASTRKHSVSAFFNVRVLIGLCVFVFGIFLALLSFGPATTGFAQGTTRAEMTVALAKVLDVFEPPPCVPGQEMFQDVPASSPFCPWIEELVRRGITTGCAPNLYCPSASVSRAQMAPFLVKSMEFASEAGRQLAAFGQIRADGSIRNSSPTLVAVTHPATGIYCLEIDPVPTQVGKESTVASVHGESAGFAGALGGVGNEGGCPFGTVPIQTRNTAGAAADLRFTFMVPR